MILVNNSIMWMWGFNCVRNFGGNWFCCRWRFWKSLSDRGMLGEVQPTTRFPCVFPNTENSTGLCSYSRTLATPENGRAVDSARTGKNTCETTLSFHWLKKELYCGFHHCERLMVEMENVCVGGDPAEPVENKPIWRKDSALLTHFCMFIDVNRSSLWWF